MYLLQGLVIARKLTSNYFNRLIILNFLGKNAKGFLDSAYQM